MTKDPLDAELEALKMSTPEPPPGFAATVMRQIVQVQGRLSVWRRWRRSARAANLLRTLGVDRAGVENGAVSGWHDAAPGGVIMKKMLWIVAGLGAAVIASSVFLGFPPTGGGTEATIGGAQRYQAAPASTPAVASSSVQDFLQTDTFDRLMKNKDARAILQKAATDPSYRAQFEDQALLGRLSGREYRNLAREQSFQDAMAKGALTVAVSEPAFHRLAEDAAFARMLADVSVQRLISDAAFVDALNSAEFRKNLTDGGMKAAIASPAAMKAMAEVAMRWNLSRAELERAVSEAAFVRMAREASFVNRLHDREYLSRLMEPSLIHLLSSPAFHDALAQPELMRMFGDQSYRALMADQSFVRSLEEPAFREMLARPGLARMLGEPSLLSAMQAR